MVGALSTAGGAFSKPYGKLVIRTIFLIKNYCTSSTTTGVVCCRVY